MEVERTDGTDLVIDSNGNGLSDRATWDGFLGNIPALYSEHFFQVSQASAMIASQPPMTRGFGHGARVAACFCPSAIMDYPAMSTTNSLDNAPGKSG